MKQQLFEEIKEHLAARLHISPNHKIFNELKDLLKSKKKLTPKDLLELERVLMSRLKGVKMLELPQINSPSSPRKDQPQRNSKNYLPAHVSLQSSPTHDVKEAYAVSEKKILRNAVQSSRSNTRRGMRGSIPLASRGTPIRLPARAKSPQERSLNGQNSFFFDKGALLRQGSTHYSQNIRKSPLRMGRTPSQEGVSLDAGKQLTVWDLMVLHDVRKFQTQEMQRRTRLAEERARLKRELKRQMDLARQKRRLEMEAAQSADSSFMQKVKEHYEREVQKQRDDKMRVRKEQSSERDQYLRYKHEEEEKARQKHESEKQQMQVHISEVKAEERERKSFQREQMLNLQAVLRRQIAGVSAKRRSFQEMEREEFARQSQYMSAYYSKRDEQTKAHLDRIQRSTQKLEKYFKNQENNKTFSVVKREEDQAFERKKSEEEKVFTKEIQRTEEMRRSLIQKQHYDLKDFLKSQMSEKVKEREMEKHEFMREQKERLRREKELQDELAKRRVKQKEEKAAMGVYLSEQMHERAIQEKQAHLLLNPREKGVNAKILREIGLQNSEDSIQLAARSIQTGTSSLV